MARATSIESVMLLMGERHRQYEQTFARLEESFKERFSQQDRATTTAFAAADKAVQAALSASEKAVSKAEMAAEKRFDSVNEFRGQLKDQQGLFATRSEVDATLRALDGKYLAAISNLERRIEDITKQMSKGVGMFEGAGTLWGYLLGAALLLVGIIALFPKLNPG